jgi:hypothetical protein
MGWLGDRGGRRGGEEEEVGRRGMGGAERKWEVWSSRGE